MSLHQLEVLQWLIFLVFCDFGMSSTTATNVYELTGSSLELNTVTLSSGFKPSSTSSTGPSCSSQLTPTSTEFEFTTAHSTPLLAISSFASSSLLSTFHSSGTELNDVMSTPVSRSSRPSSVTTTYVRCSSTIATQLVLMSETVPTTSIGTISSSLVAEYSVAKSSSSISDSVSSAQSNTASIIHPFTIGSFTPSFTIEPSTTMGISPASSYKGNHAQSNHVTLSSAMVSASASSTASFHPITPMLSSTANTATSSSSMIPSTENRAISSSTPLKLLITSTINYNPKTSALDAFATISKSSSHIVTASTSDSSLFSSNAGASSVLTLLSSPTLEPPTAVSVPSSFNATASSSTASSIIGNSVTRSAALSPSIKPYEMESFLANVTMDVRSVAIFTSRLISVIHSLPTSTSFTPTSSRIVAISLSTHETLKSSSATISIPVRATVTENSLSTSRTTMSTTTPRRSLTTTGPSTHKRTTCYNKTCLGDGCLKTLIQSQDVGFCFTNASCHIRRTVNKTYHQESASCFENTVPCDWTLFTTETIVETSDCCETDRCNTIDLLFSSAERLLPTAVMVLWVIVRVL